MPKAQTSCLSIKASSDTSVSNAEKICENALEKLSETLTEPDIGTIGGDWSVLCLARGECKRVGKEFFDSYLNRAGSSIKQLSESSGRNNGSLHRSKSTENSRVILTLSSIGADPQNINGIDLIKPLEDPEWVKKQGINGIIYALIAVDSCSYPYPEDLHEELINTILQNQTSDNGWSLDNREADPDITATALQALSKYTYRKEISEAVDKGLKCLSSLYVKYFENESIRNSETLSQIITACTCCKTDPDKDPAFIFNGTSVLQELLSYYDPDSCSFRHIKTGNTNSMATDQALIALISYERMLKNEPDIFNMNEINNYSPYLSVTGTSLDIKEELILKIYIKAEENVTCKAVKVANFTASNELINVDFNDIKETSGNSNCHILSVPVRFDRICDTLDICIYNTDKAQNKAIKYSVYDYLKNVEKSTQDTELKEVVSNLIRLAADLQMYKTHKTDDTVNDIVSSDSFSENPEFLSENHPVSFKADDDSVRYLGSDMTIDSSIKVRHSFESEKEPGFVSNFSENTNGKYIFQNEILLTPDHFFDTFENRNHFGSVYFSASDYLGFVWMHTQNIYLKRLCLSVYDYEKSVRNYYNL